MELIRECDIFNDDSAEIVKLQKKSRKMNNCKVIEDRQYYDYNGIYIYNFIIFIFSFSFLFKSMYLNGFMDKIIY